MLPPTEMKCERREKENTQKMLSYLHSIIICVLLTQCLHLIWLFLILINRNALNIIIYFAKQHQRLVTSSHTVRNRRYKMFLCKRQDAPLTPSRHRKLIHRAISSLVKTCKQKKKKSIRYTRVCTVALYEQDARRSEGGP